MSTKGIKVKKLNPDLQKDFLYFFDEVAFTDNKNWSGCYCQYYLEALEEDEWDRRTAEVNRNAAIRRIGNRTMNGFVAYENNIPIGWCHADFKKNIAAFSHERNGEDVVIVCFVISPEHRRKGVATKLLNEVIETYKAKGVEYLEAYPSKNIERPDVNYHGFLNMYQKAGFKIVKEEDTRYLVRQKL